MVARSANRFHTIRSATFGVPCRVYIVTPAVRATSVRRSSSLPGTAIARMGTMPVIRDSIFHPMHRQGAIVMSIAKVIELSAESEKSFEDAIQQGIAGATETLENV